jgi:hypothetical protein
MHGHLVEAIVERQTTPELGHELTLDLQRRRQVFFRAPRQRAIELVAADNFILGMRGTLVAGGVDSLPSLAQLIG